MVLLLPLEPSKLESTLAARSAGLLDFRLNEPVDRIRRVEPTASQFNRRNRPTGLRQVRQVSRRNRKSTGRIDNAQQFLGITHFSVSLLSSSTRHAAFQRGLMQSRDEQDTFVQFLAKGRKEIFWKPNGHRELRTNSY
jgi:hypothetical protein